ncbi:MAG: helix-turn-helix transcriptional regulator [Christiangramia sp.]
MVNTEKFASRLNKILEYYDISAASFADKIEVGRSSISHILSGRNKPSLDFVMKVVKNFPEVELYWLLNGKGKFPSSTESENTPNAEKENEISPSSTPDLQVASDEKQTNSPILPQTKSGKQIQKIVIFYTDGSFEAFEN